MDEKEARIFLTVIMEMYEAIGEDEKIAEVGKVNAGIRLAGGVQQDTRSTVSSTIQSAYNSRIFYCRLRMICTLRMCNLHTIQHIHNICVKSHN